MNLSILFSEIVNDKADMQAYDSLYKERNNQFEALCDFKEQKLSRQRPTLELFEEVVSDKGLAEACNELFFSALNENEKKFLNKKAKLRNIDVKFVFEQLSNNYFKNPLRLVL